ncbi:MAG: RHS repeat-associated core domain-containing protein, partial [Planctomycetota bacterium]
SMVTDQEGTTTEYEYLSEPANYLSKTIGPDGQITQRTEYDDQGRIVATIDAEGHRVEQFWDPTNFSGTITDGNGNVTTLTYNERGNVLQEIDAANSVTLYEYGDQRHPDLETRIVDRRGFVTDRAYDDAGNLTRSSELGPMDAFWDQPLVSSFTYDANGYLTSQANPRGHQTRWEYDASGNVTAVVDANLNRQTSLYDERGRLIERSDFNQKVTSVSYSTNDQPTRIAFADGSHAEFQHNEFGQLALEQVFESDGTLVQQIQITYDRTGRVATQIVGIDGDDDHPATLTHRVYDAGLLDYVVFTNPESLDGDGVPIESPLTPVEERLSAIVDYEYDGNGRLIRETDPQGGVTEHRYDGNGNHILRQDPIGNITTWVYDSLNRVSEMRDPFFHLGMTISDALATLDVPSGADCDSNAVASHLTLSCYDAEGNLTKRIDRNERRIEFDHDHRGRVLEERWFDEADNVIRSASFEYDAIGNLISAADANSHYAFEYDSLNRLVSSDNNPNDSLAIPRTVLSYSHDPQGNVLQTSDQSGVLVESRYDQRDRLLSRDWSLSDLDTARIDFFYSAVGRETEAQRFDGDDQLVSRTLRTYDSVSRPDSVTHLDAADGLFAEYEYGYNFAGLVTSKELTRPDASQSESFDYRYDLNGQVVESLSGNGGTESFQYDANGNRVGIGNQVGENNQLLADSEYTYEYDAEGNLIGRTEIANGNVTVYEYDHRNRLITVQESSAEGVVLSETRYTYDVLNRRIAQTKNGETLHTVYNADNAWADFGDDGSVVTRYLFGERVDQVLARFEPNEGITWHLTDTQGSVRELVDAAGNPIFQISYDTFGIASTMSLESTGRYLYAGREYDQDVGLYYNRARFYDPLQGRFLSQDPLGFNAGDSNLYRYVGNSPANGTDPTGEATALEYAMKAVYAVALLNIACAAVDFAADLELDYEVDPAKIALQGGFAAGSGVVAFGFGPVGALVLGIVNASLNLYACATGDTV